MPKTRHSRLLIAASVIGVVAAVSVLGPLKKPILYVWNAECFGWSTNDVGPRLVALGDSIAEGNSYVALGIHGDTSWYSYLVCGADAPAANGANLGKTGQTTDRIHARIDDALAAAPDILVVNGGTNDQARGVPLVDIVANLTAILDRAMDVDTVVLATVPRARSARSGPDDPLNDAIRGLAMERGLPVADFAQTLAEPGATLDGVHPTAKSARIMAGQVMAAVALGDHA